MSNTNRTKETNFKLVKNDPITNKKRHFNLRIAQLCDANYGYYIWPASLKMAKFIYENSNGIFSSENSNLLELGSGTSLPSIVARKTCHLNRIIITDDLTANPKLLDLITTSMRLNEISIDTSSETSENGVSVENFSWSNFNEAFIQRIPKIDFLIGSDVFFDSKLFEDLILTVSFLIEFNNPNMIFYTTFENRSSESYLKLIYLLEKYQLEWQIVKTTTPNHHQKQQQQQQHLASLDPFEIDLKTSHEIILLRVVAKSR